MMRKANPESDFSFAVDGIGSFTYGRRTIGDSLKIRARFLELVGEHADDVEIAANSSVIATHEVLCVSAPDGWENMLALDALGDDTFSKIFDLYKEVEKQEDSFRSPKKVDSAAPGKGSVKDPGLLVPA